MKSVMHAVWQGVMASIPLIAISCAWPASAQEVPFSDPEFDRILSLDIAELSVTSVSRIPEMAATAAAAVYVISSHDLERAGVTSIPEALRMVPGVQVAQSGAHGWAVSIRGFNGQFANKLQVLMDGRSIYSPIFSGVYWDMEDTVIEDIERIEVIRGPGATLWGSNAVNGIINIVTKKSADTQGKYLSATIGNHEYLTTEGRYGGSLDKDTFYRVYAKQLHHGKSSLLTGGDAFDDWTRLRSGFRLDKTQEDDNYTVQGDIYHGRQGLLTTLASLTAPFATLTPSEDEAYGGNVLARLERTLSATSSMRFQFYINNYSRSEIVAQQQNVTSIDADFQHVLKPTNRHELVWGGGYRFILDTLKGSPTASFMDQNGQYDIVNVFIQDQYAVIPDKVFFTLGSKLEHNSFTGMEIQPTTRISWRMSDSQTLWAAISRAVRVPSRAESDLDLLALVLPGNPPTALYARANAQATSEELIAYELGYKLYPSPKISFDISAFFNNYDKLTTLSQGTPFSTASAIVIPYSYTNNADGHVYGAEAALKWNVSTRWQLHATYSYLLMDLHAKQAGIDILNYSERSNPNHQLSFRSILDLPHNLEWDNMLYFVDDIENARAFSSIPVAENIRFDSRLGWKPMLGLELSLIGRNLLNAPHAEFLSNPAVEIGPSVIGMVKWKF